MTSRKLKPFKHSPPITSLSNSRFIALKKIDNNTSHFLYNKANWRQFNRCIHGKIDLSKRINSIDDVSNAITNLTNYIYKMQSKSQFLKLNQSHTIPAYRPI